MIETIKNTFLLDRLNSIYGERLINLYPYGGQVYNVANSLSDLDYIAIVASDSEESHVEFNEDNIKLDVNVFNDYSFSNMIEDNEITALECLSLPDNLVIKQTIKYKLELNLNKLREAISSKSSHSFVKARKKIRYGEYYIGKKSLWHSFRIIYFGIQVAKYGKIVDFSEANHLYDDIVLNSSIDEEYYKEKYLKLHNELMTEFRKLAPKAT